VVGRTLPLSGPIAAYGQAKMEGADLLIRHVNATGGINGRKLVAVTLDDGYDPLRAVSNVRELDAKHKPVALLNTLGVPVVAKLMPVLEELKLPGLGLSTGSAAVREPASRYVLPVRAGYREEGEHTIRLLQSIGVNRIALVEQDDLFGKTVADGYREAMQSSNQQLAGTFKMKRDQPDATPVVAALQQLQPQAVLVALNALPASEFVKRYRAAGGGARLYAMSVTDTTQIAKLAGEDARGMGFSQVVPLPTSSSRRVVRDYLELAQAAGHTPSFYSLEGYLETRVLVEALRKPGKPPSREGLVDALEGLRKVDLGGYEVEYGTGNRRGASFVELVIIGPGGRLLK